MQDFINELEYNQKINLNLNIKNSVNINYVIEKLEEIQKNVNDEIDFFKYHNKNLTKTQEEKIANLNDIINNSHIPF